VGTEAPAKGATGLQVTVAATVAVIVVAIVAASGPGEIAKAAFAQAGIAGTNAVQIAALTGVANAVQIAALTAVLTAAANAVVFDPVVTVVRAKVGLDLALTGPLNAVLSALAPHRPVLLMQTAISASQPDLARAKR